MAAERQPVFGKISGLWAAALAVALVLIACGVWLFAHPIVAADSGGRAQTIASTPSTDTTDSTAASGNDNKENTATPMIGQATGNDGSPRPKTAGQ